MLQSKSIFCSNYGISFIVNNCFPQFFCVIDLIEAFDKVRHNCSMMLLHFFLNILGQFTLIGFPFINTLRLYAFVNLLVLQVNIPSLCSLVIDRSLVSLCRYTETAVLGKFMFWIYLRRNNLVSWLMIQLLPESLIYGLK